MSQLLYKWKEKLGGIVHKAIFLKPLGNDKYIEIAQRYINIAKPTFKLDSNHEYVIHPEDWRRQSRNRYIQYRDYDMAYKVIGLFEIKEWETPLKRKVTAKEIAYNKVGDVAKGVVSGAQLNAGLVLLIISLVAGLMGGMLLGYFGLPAVTGQHLVANAVPK